MLLEIQSVECFMHLINLNATEGRNNCQHKNKKKPPLLSMITVFITCCKFIANKCQAKPFIYLRAHFYFLKWISCN